MAGRDQALEQTHDSVLRGGVRWLRSAQPLRSAKEVRVKPLPRVNDALLLRTDFSDDAAWVSLCEAVQQPNEAGFKANVACISDVAYEALAVGELVARAPKGDQCGHHAVAFVADAQTFSDVERPMLVVNLNDQPGRTFRVIPREMWSVENNLSIANMDYDDFAEHTDADGVFRGFPKA